MNRLFTLLALVLVLGGFLIADGRSAADEAAVRQTAQWYLDAGDTRDPALMRRAFHPDAYLLFNGDQGYTKLPFAEWVARMEQSTQSTGPQPQRKAEVTSVDVAGDVAVAKIAIETETVRIVDFLSMVKIDGEWKIVNKIFTRQPKSNG
jgi:hypothetical protein